MRIDIRSGAEITVPHPELHLLHAHSRLYQKAGAGVPEVMEPDGRQIMLFEQPAKVRREKVGRNNLPIRQQTDVSFPFIAPAAPELFPVQFLLLPGLQEYLLHLGNQRKHPVAGLVFQFVLPPP